MVHPFDVPSDGPPDPPPESPKAPGLRHDLASPLTVIRCHAQLARLRSGRWDAPPGERAALQTHLHAIEDAVDRIVALLFPERAVGDAATAHDEPH